MKRLIFITLMLWPMMAHAMWPARAVEPVTFRAISSYRLTSVSTATSTPSTALGAIGNFTKVVRLLCTQDCWVAFPVTNIVAAATIPLFLPANVQEYFLVSPGTYVQVRMDSSSGNVYITEMDR